MKADGAWQALEGKVAGTDVQYKDVVVWPLIAVTAAPTCPPGALPACMLPAALVVSGAAQLLLPCLTVLNWFAHADWHVP